VFPYCGTSSSSSCCTWWPFIRNARCQVCWAPWHTALMGQVSGATLAAPCLQGLVSPLPEVLRGQFVRLSLTKLCPPLAPPTRVQLHWWRVCGCEVGGLHCGIDLVLTTRLPCVCIALMAIEYMFILPLCGASEVFSIQSPPFSACASDSHMSCVRSLPIYGHALPCTSICVRTASLSGRQADCQRVRSILWRTALHH